MSTRASPTSSRRLRSATCTTPSGSSAPEPRASLRGGDAEEDHRGDAEVGERPHLLAEALLRVLHDARHRRDRLGVVDALLHEERRDEVVDREPGLGDEAAQRGRAAQPAHARARERSRRQATATGLASSVVERTRQRERARSAATSPSMVCCVGLGVDAQAALDGGGRRDRADRDDERLRVGQRPDEVAEVVDGRRRRERDRVDPALARPGRATSGSGVGGARCGRRAGRRPS